MSDDYSNDALAVLALLYQSSQPYSSDGFDPEAFEGAPPALFLVPPSPGWPEPGWPEPGADLDLFTRIAYAFAPPPGLENLYPSLLNRRLRREQAEKYPVVAEAITQHRRLRSKKKWRGGKPASVKSNALARAESGRLAEARRTWKQANRAKINQQKAIRRGRNYHKPFIAIDFEGQNYPGDDIEHNGVIYPKHRAFLAMAGGWKRTADPVKLAERMANGEQDNAAKGVPLTPLAKDMREGKELKFEALGEENKRPLTSIEIIEWLLSLPEKYGDAHFLMFSFNYDVTQMLAELGRKKVWEICKQKEFDGSPRGGEEFRAPVLCGPYAIKYIKSKKLNIWRLRDRERSHKKIIDKKTGKIKNKLDTIAHIEIDDTFGFYQERFVKVTESLVKDGYFSQADHDMIAANKEKRADFDTTPFETIKHYCSLELVALSKALTVLRDAFDKMGLTLDSWSGAGSAAKALLQKEKINKNHFPDDIMTNNILSHQEAAHRAYFGANIQLLKQGYAPKQELFGYDIASAYPAACLELPSMAGGKWERSKTPVFFNDNFEKLKQEIARENILSMFLVDWFFPNGPMPVYNRKTRKYDYGRAFPFFPLPYRMKNGAVLFPNAGLTWIMRDELLGALQWIETFFSTHKEREFILRQNGCFTIRERWRFHPANDEKPFAFVEALYKRRIDPATPPALNKAIKLCLNSLYGKMAQSVGGGNGKPPPTANPYYAAAITANCRMRAMLAALLAPHDIVMFATDGIISTKELTGLPRCFDADANPGKPPIGDWEMNRLGGGLYLQSGVYVNFKRDGAVKIIKTRGFNPLNMMMKSVKISTAQFLAETVSEWRKKYDRDGPNQYPRLEIKQRVYVTAGAAVASKEAFRAVGRWGEERRFINLHSLGGKRVLIDNSPVWRHFYCSGEPPLSNQELEDFGAYLDKPIQEIRACHDAGEAFRCRMLVPSFPATNPTPANLSAPSMPDWLDKDREELIEGEEEQAEIMAGMS